MVFREGRTKAVGNVLKLIPNSNTMIMPSRANKPNKQSQNRQGSSSVMQACNRNVSIYEICITVNINLFHCVSQQTQQKWVPRSKDRRPSKKTCSKSLA